jgi:hypothetical protein
MLNQRFLERKDNKKLLKSYADFSYRGYSAKAKYIFYVFTALVTVAVVVIMFYVGHISNKDGVSQTAQFKDVVFALFLSIVCSGTIAVLSSYFLFKVTGALILTEFQSFIFSSSAKSGTFFFMVIAPDGTIFYHDEDFFQNFEIESKTNREVLNEFLNHKAFDGKFQKLFLDAITNKRSLNSLTSLNFRTGKKKLLINVSRVKNLSYFLVVSGREVNEEDGQK